jgi:hypothetical protein
MSAPSGQDHTSSRTQLPPAFDERAILATFLDHSVTVHAKCQHLAVAGARRAPLPSSPLIVDCVRWML